MPTKSKSVQRREAIIGKAQKVAFNLSTCRNGLTFYRTSLFKAADGKSTYAVFEVVDKDGKILESFKSKEI